MKILFLTAEYPPDLGGVGDYTRCLAQSLATSGVDVRVLTGMRHQDAEPDPLVLRRVRAWDWRCWHDVQMALLALQPDVLHIQYQTGAYGMHPAINLLPSWLQRMTLRPRLVVTFHDLLPPYLFPKAGLVRDRVTRALADSSDAVIVTNVGDALRLPSLAHTPLLTRHQPEPLTIPIGSNIPRQPLPGYTSEAWRARLEVGAEECVLAYFGLISPSKGLDTLLDALVQLDWRSASGRPLRLLVIGGEVGAEHDRPFADTLLSRMRALPAQIIVTGHVDAAEVSGHLIAADIVALPFRDGASLRRGSLMAALTHGCAIITTEPAADRELRDAKACCFVAPDSVEQLMQAISTLADDPSARERLCESAQAYGAQFEWGRIAAQHRELYEQVLEQ